MPIGRAILWLDAAGFVAFGAAFAFWPAPVAALVDIALPTPTARIDFAATYGGFELGVGAFLVACARRSDWVEAGLFAGGAALAGFALVRALTLLTVGGPVDTPIYVALALELTGVALNWWGLNSWRKSRRI
jgi:hypothetical protein